jgi:hypothetical protein
MRWESKRQSRHPERLRTRTWRVFGYRASVTYEQSPFVARWGYAPIATVMGVILGLVVGRLL